LCEASRRANLRFIRLVSSNRQTFASDRYFLVARGCCYAYGVRRRMMETSQVPARQPRFKATAAWERVIHVTNVVNS